jgi:hypothetical protein
MWVNPICCSNGIFLRNVLTALWNARTVQSPWIINQVYIEKRTDPACIIVDKPHGSDHTAKSRELHHRSEMNGAIGVITHCSVANRSEWKLRILQVSLYDVTDRCIYHVTRRKLSSSNSSVRATPVSPDNNTQWWAKAWQLGCTALLHQSYSNWECTSITLHEETSIARGEVAALTASKWQEEDNKKTMCWPRNFNTVACEIDVEL